MPIFNSTVDETNDEKSCNLVIFGQDSDHADPSPMTLIILPTGKTAAAVSHGRRQLAVHWRRYCRTANARYHPHYSEVVNRAGYTANSSIVIIIEGQGGELPSLTKDPLTERGIMQNTAWGAGIDCSALSANVGDPAMMGTTPPSTTPSTTIATAPEHHPCTHRIGDADGDGVR